MGSKMLTRVPPDEIASASLSEKLFSHYASSLENTASLYQCEVSILVKKKNIEQTIFRLFLEFMYQDQNAFILLIDIIILIIRGENKVLLCFS